MDLAELHRSAARPRWHAPLALALEELPIDDSWSNMIVSGGARKQKADLWTVVFFDFSIRAHGATLHEALDAAGSELAVYILHECKRRLPGLPNAPLALEEMMRPIQTRKRVKWELGAIVSHVYRIFDDKPSFDVYSLNVPIAHATCLADPEVVEALEETCNGDGGDDADEALMAEGYRELTDDLLAFAEETLAAAAETFPSE